MDDLAPGFAVFGQEVGNSLSACGCVGHGEFARSLRFSVLSPCFNGDRKFGEAAGTSIWTVSSLNEEKNGRSTGKNESNRFMMGKLV